MLFIFIVTNLTSNGNCAKLHSTSTWVDCGYITLFHLSVKLNLFITLQGIPTAIVPAGTVLFSSCHSNQRIVGRAIVLDKQFPILVGLRLSTLNRFCYKVRPRTSRRNNRHQSVVCHFFISFSTENPLMIIF